MGHMVDLLKHHPYKFVSTIATKNWPIFWLFPSKLTNSCRHLGNRFYLKLDQYPSYFSVKLSDDLGCGWEEKGKKSFKNVEGGKEIRGSKEGTANKL